MRRFIGFLFILALIMGVALVVYVYLVDLPPQTQVVETPAVGVGFAD
ncbi:MAG: hypothetical protein AAF367_00055 [Pseudomonadota bacterium]